MKVESLWVQDIKSEDRAVFEKIDGKGNPADLMTKYVSANLLNDHCRKLYLQAEDGRAGSASKVSRGI